MPYDTIIIYILNVTNVVNEGIERSELLFTLLSSDILTKNEALLFFASVIPLSNTTIKCFHRKLAEKMT